MVQETLGIVSNCALMVSALWRSSVVGESSSSIRSFCSDAMNFEVFSKQVVPIKVRIWVLCYKVVRWVNWIWGIYWIVVGGDIYVYRNWGWNPIWNYVDWIDRNVYRPRVWLRVIIKGIFVFPPWQKIWLRRQSIFWIGYWLILWGYQRFGWESRVIIYSWNIRKPGSYTSVSFVVLSCYIDAVLLSVCNWFNWLLHRENWIQCLLKMLWFLGSHIYQRCVQYFHTRHKVLKRLCVLIPLNCFQPF